MKNKKINIIITLIILAVGGWAIYISQKPFAVDKTDFVIDKRCGEYSSGEVILNNQIIKILISDTDCKRQLGLSGVTSLKKDEGLLFVFDKVGKYGFWMKDMLFSIDILWIGDDFKVVGIEKNVSTSTYPKIFGENYNALYVLELASGYSSENKIEIGDSIIFHNK